MCLTFLIYYPTSPSALVRHIHHTLSHHLQRAILSKDMSCFPMYSNCPALQYPCYSITQYGSTVYIGMAMGGSAL